MTECWAIYMILCTCVHTHTQIFSWGPFSSSNNEVWRIKVVLLFATGAQTFIHFVSICCHTLLPLCHINKGHYWCPQSSLCSLAIYLGLLGIPGGGGGGGRGETIWRQFFMCHFRFFSRRKTVRLINYHIIKAHIINVHSAYGHLLTAAWQCQ